MKIKLHNSMGKSNNTFGLKFLFNDKILIYLSLNNNYLHLYHRIYDRYSFLIFYLDTNELEEGYGFEVHDNESTLNWWKKSIYNWKDIGESDENPIT